MESPERDRPIQRPELPTGMPSLMHVLPSDDIFEHVPTDRCTCGPTREPIGTRKIGYQGGQRVIVAVHPRLDGKPTGWETPT